MAVSVGEKVYVRPLDLPPFPEIPDDYLPNNVEVHFHFAPHSLAENFDAAAELLRAADVYIPESAGWHNSALRDINAIAKGDRRAIARAKEARMDQSMSGYMNAQADALARSYKPVALVDARAEEKEWLQGDFDYAHRRIRGQSADQYLESVADLMWKVARKAAMRNRIVVRNLGPVVSRLAQEHPRLKQKSTIAILSTFGHAHHEIYDYLATQPNTADKVTFSYWSAIGYPDPENAVLDPYMQEREPSRLDLIRCSAAFMLTRTTSFDGVRPFYNSGELVRRKPDVHYLAGAKMLELMMRDPERALQWVFAARTKRLSMPDGTRPQEYLSTYAAEAEKLVSSGF